MKPTLREIEYVKEWTPRCKGNIALFSEKLLGIKFHKGQQRVYEIERSKFYPVNLELIPNRWGKTVYKAIKHIYKNFYKECGPGLDLDPADWVHLEYQTLNVAPSSENTKIMLKMILQICRGEFSIRDGNRVQKNPSHLRYLVDLDGLSNYTKIPDQGPFAIRFANKSLFRAFTLGQTHGDAIQGDKYGYASYDEFGRSKNPEKEIDDILPRLTDFNGELDIITTPDMENEVTVAYLLQKREYAKEKGSEWRFIGGTYDENHHIPIEDRERRLRGMSEEKRRQILFGDISLANASYFEIEKVNKLFEPHRFAQPFRGAKIWVGLDTAGSGNDYWAMTTISNSVTPWQVLETYYDKKSGPHTNLAITMNKLDKYIKYYGRENVTLVMDCTNEAGSIYYEDLKDYAPIKYRFGIQKITGKSTKALLTDTLRRALNEELLRCPENVMLKHQLLMYKGPNDDEKLVTDALMSIALAIYYPFNDHIDIRGGIVTDLD